jgi:hypothetical protein
MYLLFLKYHIDFFSSLDKLIFGGLEDLNTTTHSYLIASKFSIFLVMREY